MNKYTNGKIYRLTCNITGLNYYGSTVQPLHKRKNEHKCKYQYYLKDKKKYYTAFKIIEGGNYNIILVEEFLCENRNQLEARERYHIENNECVNKIIPTRTIKEYQEINKEHYKEYRDKYRQENKEKQKKYYEANKEQIKQKNKEYKEKIKEQKKNMI
jgi:hypothetical protein